jgi:hypothetical protein
VLVATALTKIRLASIVGQLFYGIDSEALLAVPFFLLERDVFVLNRGGSRSGWDLIQDAGWAEASRHGTTIFDGPARAGGGCDCGWRDVATRGGGAFRRCGEHGDQMDAASAPDRQRGTGSDGRP